MSLLAAALIYSEVNSQVWPVGAELQTQHAVVFPTELLLQPLCGGLKAQVQFSVGSLKS